MWSNSAFYNRCQELTNCNRRSCQLKQGGLVAAPTLVASPCVDVSRCSISSSHSRGRSLCACSWYTPHTHDISTYPLYPKTMEKATMVRVIRVLGECNILSQLLRQSVISLHFLPEFIGELKNELKRPLVVKYSDREDGPLQSLEQKLDDIIKIKQHLKLTQRGL